MPAWLNDPTYYHNRGNAKFDGTESDVYGDFVGLDDLFTEQPAVRDGLIDIYKFWAEFGIDGFRIDTVKHVNIEFWQKFSPAMEQAAASAGKPKFFQFGEVYDAEPENDVAVHHRGQAAGHPRLRVPGRGDRLRQGQRDDRTA